MTRQPAPARRSRGFTLIELLTVVAIISLLIGILLPSLARARDQAKKAKILGMISSIDKALEMFHTDFGQYPDSSQAADPIDWNGAGVSPAVINITGASATLHMSGAHWLARALVGHDFRGVDAAGASMASNSVTYAQLSSATRKGTYFDGNRIYFRDDDATSGLSGTSGGTTTTNDFKPTGRIIIMDDAFASPILYYRANERAGKAFTADPGVSGGVYSHKDNLLITGDGSGVRGWDFGSTAQPHQIAPYSGSGNDPTAANIADLPSGFRNTFVRYLYNANALASSGGMTIRPMNADRFVLISAGKDGLYGTEDDINNFNSAR